jgi:retron-type reverse transcriptase
MRTYERVKRGMASGARALGSRSFHRSLRTGKPSTRAQRRARSPRAKGSRFPHGKDAKVRETRTAETILTLIQDRGKRQLPLDDVSRPLSPPDLSLRSYAKLYPNDGAMTPGMTAETVDGWSMEKMAAIIVAIRDERWQWTPVKRVLIAKPKGGKRPLGLPVWSDKVGQDIIRSILEASYEPQCSNHSHGFRPHRGCHTALKEIDEVWHGTKWFIEGDIKGCFANIDQTILMHILRENIQDNRFLRLIEGALKAGYCEAWKYHPSLSGSPQGGIVSPILSNISMDRL